jgi:hypothetical protein
MIYVERRNNLRRTLASAKRKHVANTLSDLRGNVKKIWRELNNLMGRTPVLKLPEHDSSFNLATRFNDFFSNKVENLRNQMVIQKSSLTTPPHPVPPLSQAKPELMSFDLTNVVELKKTFLLAPRKTSPQDILPNWLLRECIHDLLPVLTAIVNLALTFGLPSLHKHSIVTPLIKKAAADSNIMPNYRPVSNLSTLSKTIEKIVSKRLFTYLQENNLMDNEQCAYKKFNSCEQALIDIQDYALRAADKGEVTALLLFDMTAAFDTVDHTILLERLLKLGIGGDAHCWLSNYLMNRTQVIRINGVDSNPIIMKCGVPQGSVMGPLLFTIYIRPLGHIIEQHQIKFKFYADDLQLYSSFKPIDKDAMIEKLEACVMDVQRWLLDNMLCLNPMKSEFILLGSRSQLKKLVNMSVKVGEISLQHKDIVRDLGVLLDGSLTFEKHVQTVTRNAFYYLRNIAQAKRMLTPRHRATLVHSLVFSRIEFCSGLFLGLNAKSLRKFQRVITSSIHVVHGKTIGSGDEKTKTWLNAEQRIKLRVACLTWNSLNGRSPIFMSRMFKPLVQQRTLRSSDDKLLEVPWMRTDMGKRAFSVAASRLWNSLPLAIRDVKSSDLFLRGMTNHFLYNCVGE